MNIAFCHSKSYFGIRTGAEYLFWLSESYFNIRIPAEYLILTFEFTGLKSYEISHDLSSPGGKYPFDI